MLSRLSVVDFAKRKHQLSGPVQSNAAGQRAVRRTHAGYPAVHEERRESARGGATNPDHGKRQRRGSDAEGRPAGAPHVGSLGHLRERNLDAQAPWIRRFRDGLYGIVAWDSNSGEVPEGGRAPGSRCPFGIQNGARLAATAASSARRTVPRRLHEVDQTDPSYGVHVGRELGHDIPSNSEDRAAEGCAILRRYIEGISVSARTPPTAGDPPRPEAGEHHDLRVRPVQDR
mmetsp:Transcript_964/g.1702  ORF Transcript_964/g.1702 Transcript_964/m.1702 type:complete len:230 (+) Transcript_964:428-1117(+)